MLTARGNMTSTVGRATSCGSTESMMSQESSHSITFSTESPLKKCKRASVSSQGAELGPVATFMQRRDRRAGNTLPSWAPHPGRSLENIDIEINWNRDLDYSDFIEMQEFDTVQKLFDIIDDARPDELLKGGDVIKEIRIKSKTALYGPDGPVFARIIRGETQGKASIDHLIYRLKSQPAEMEIELLFEVIWENSMKFEPTTIRNTRPAAIGIGRVSGNENHADDDRKRSVHETYRVADQTVANHDTRRTRSNLRHKSEEQEQQNSRPRRTIHPAPAFSSTKRPASRVGQRSQHVRRRSSFSSVKSDESDARPALANKTFPCPFVIYGCLSDFGNKNEWKRHIQTQHMLLEHWHCEQCEEAQESRRPNDFNRRDLFIQHILRMHPWPSPKSTAGRSKKSKTLAGRSEAELAYLESEATRCHRQLRKPPDSSRCLLCEQHFRGPGAWEQRLEHLGRHFEEAKRRKDVAPVDSRYWHSDHDTEQYLLREGILVQRGQRLALAHEKLPG